MGAWHGQNLGVVESMGRAPKMFQFENWNIIENCYTINTSNVTTSLAGLEGLILGERAHLCKESMTTWEILQCVFFEML